MKKIVILLLVTFIYKFSYSQDWISVTSSHKEAKFYIRSGSVSDDYIKKVWTKIVSTKTIYLNKMG